MHVKAVVRPANKNGLDWINQVFESALFAKKISNFVDTELNIESISIHLDKYNNVDSSRFI